jgi:hypothetical protein
MSDWQPFNDKYEKHFYEVLAGNQILQHFWPNGGLLIGSGWYEDDPTGWYLKFGYSSDAKIRPCKCAKCSPV